MTTESLASVPSISIEHIHATLLTEINDLMERAKAAKKPEISLALVFQAKALAGAYPQLVSPTCASIGLLAHLKQVGQLLDAATETFA